MLNFLAVLSLLLCVALAGLWRSSQRQYLYGIGHNGSAFTTVELHREGLPADAPVAAFTAMSKAAVRQLAPR